jgi:hypothetical protein
MLIMKIRRGGTDPGRAQEAALHRIDSGLECGSGQVYNNNQYGIKLKFWLNCLFQSGQGSAPKKKVVMTPQKILPRLSDPTAKGNPPLVQQTRRLRLWIGQHSSPVSRVEKPF